MKLNIDYLEIFKLIASYKFSDYIFREAHKMI